ncbi:MAG: hypothetical protein EB127_03720 [Alphaproteobacteria bacterium]|nr:hypothetical protein [Alphaproteobacteria bacterium]
MKNKDVKKYIKYLCYQINAIEKDISNAYKHIELSTLSLKSVNAIIKQLSEEAGKQKISYQNLKDNRVDVVYETYDGIKKEFNVPVHPYNEVEINDVLSRLEAIAKVDVPSKSISNMPVTSMEEKAIAFTGCCGKCKKN